MRSTAEAVRPSVRRVGMALAWFLVYLPVYLVLKDAMRGVGALITVPVLVASWMMGWRGGLAAALLAIAINTLLYGGVLAVARAGGAPGMISLIPIGMMMGWMRELNLQVKLQLAERTRMEAELAAAERRRLEVEAAANLTRAGRLAAVGSLAASLAHQINNPLAFAMANLRFVADHLDPELQTPEDADDVRAAVAETLEGLARIQSVVAGIRVISNGSDLVEQAVDVCAVLDAAIKVIEVGPGQGTELEVEHRYPPGAPPYVKANQGRLAQAFLNLLTNAIEALPGESGRRLVRISTQVKDHRVSVEISDSGRGIPPEVQARLFQPFVTTKPAGATTGAGLGLFVSRNILHAAGGELTYTTRVGQGSTFRVELPASPSAGGLVLGGGAEPG